MEIDSSELQPAQTAPATSALVLQLPVRAAPALLQQWPQFSPTTLIITITVTNNRSKSVNTPNSGNSDGGLVSLTCRAIGDGNARLLQHLPWKYRPQRR